MCGGEICDRLLPEQFRVGRFHDIDEYRDPGPCLFEAVSDDFRSLARETDTVDQCSVSRESKDPGCLPLCPGCPVSGRIALMKPGDRCNIRVKSSTGERT